jgi:FkbM family methyltransferase
MERKYYSQNDEEKIILEYFGDYVGSLLDLGANDGVTLSNSYALVERGWSAVLVEASKKAFDRLVDNMESNSNVVLLPYAVGAEDGIVTFHESGELLGVGDTSLVSSVKKEELSRWKPANVKFTEIKVPMMRFNKLIELSGVSKFDFITMDIEGVELDVLPQIDFNKLATSMVIVEFNGKEQHKYDSLILPFGFKLIHRNAENLIYAQ